MNMKSKAFKISVDIVWNMYMDGLKVPYMKYNYLWRYSGGTFHKIPLPVRSKINYWFISYIIINMKSKPAKMIWDIIWNMYLDGLKVHNFKSMFLWRYSGNTFHKVKSTSMEGNSGLSLFSSWVWSPKHSKLHGT